MPNDSCLCINFAPETSVTIPSGTSVTFPRNPPFNLSGSTSPQVTLPAGTVISFPAGQLMQVGIPGRPPLDLLPSGTNVVVTLPDGTETYGGALRVDFRFN